MPSSVVTTDFGVETLARDCDRARRTDFITRRSLTRVLKSVAGLPASMFDDLWFNVDDLVQAGHPLKLGRRCTVVRLKGRCPAAVLKRYNARGPAHAAAHWFWPSRAMRCWNFGHQLIAAGVETPRPLAAVEHRWGPVRRRSFLLTEHVSGTSLRKFCKYGRPTPSQIESLARQFAGMWKTLGVLSLSHGDLKTSNLLVTTSGRLCLIDLDSIRRHRSRSAFESARRRDWQRFLRDWQDFPEIGSEFRQCVQPPIENAILGRT